MLRADRVLGDSALRATADRVVLRALVLDDSFRWVAANVELGIKSVVGKSNIFLGESNRSASKTDLVDKVSNFIGAQIHVLVNVVDTGRSFVGWITFLTNLGATKNGAKVWVNMLQMFASCM
jgi:hypothetical protein